MCSGCWAAARIPSHRMCGTSRVGAILALGALGGLAVGQANAMPAVPLTPSIPIPPPSPAESSSGNQSSATSVNDIKIGNRSQLSRTQQGAWYDIVGPTVGTGK
jgi:hypothetical protein